MSLDLSVTERCSKTKIYKTFTERSAHFTTRINIILCDVNTDTWIDVRAHAVVPNEVGLLRTSRRDNAGDEVKWFGHVTLSADDIAVYQPLDCAPITRGNVIQIWGTDRTEENK